MPRIAQVRRVIFNDEEIGMGFNSESGLAVGTPLEGFNVAEDSVASGQEVIASITIVNSHEELMDTMGMSFAAHGRYGFFSASAKATFADSSHYNSNSTFLVARCVVQNPMRRGHGFRVSDPAQRLLDSLRFDEFKRAFGDSFVRGLQTGGEFYAVIRITSVSTDTQSALAVTLQAEANGLVAGGSFQGQFNQANQSVSTRSEFTATMFQQAGSGAQISPTVEIDDVIERFKQFPAIAKENAIAYETEVATYDTLPLQVPTPEEQDDFLFALADAREKKLRFIQTRNDLDFALRNPTFFEDLPAADVLTGTAASYTRLINAVMEHAIKLSRGEIRPPKVFDPSALTPPLTEPAPITLKRATPTAGVPSIVVPNFVGFDVGTLEVADRCLAVGDIDGCMAGTVFTDQDGNPAPINLPREVFEIMQLARRTALNIRMDPDVTASAITPETGDFICRAQFPAAGGLVASDGEIILQMVAEGPG